MTPRAIDKTAVAKLTVKARVPELGLSKGLPPPLPELLPCEVEVVLLDVVLLETFTVVVTVALLVELTTTAGVSVDCSVDCVEVVVVLGAVGFPVSVMMPLVGTDWDERCSMLDPIDSVMGFGVEAAPPLPVVCVTTATLQRT